MPGGCGFSLFSDVLWGYLPVLPQYNQSSCCTHPRSMSFANPNLRILNTTSGGVSFCRLVLQSHPRLIGPLTSTPLLDADVVLVLWRLRFCDRNIELPTILK